MGWPLLDWHWEEVVSKLFMSNHYNVVGHVEILDVEVGRNEIVRGDAASKHEL
jgi:hypothetical protein